MNLSKFLHYVPARDRNDLIVAFWTGLLFWTSMASQLPAIPLYVKGLGASNAEVGIVMGAFAIGLLLCRSPLGRMADRQGRKAVMQVGLAVAAGVPVLYAIAHTIPVLILLRAVHGISIAAFATGYSAFVADRAPVERRGEIVGYMSLVQSLGLAIGPAIGGLTHEAWGAQVMFGLASTFALGGWICVRQLQELKPWPASDRSPATLSLWATLTSARVRVPAALLFLIGLVFGNLSAFLPLLIETRGVGLNAGLFYLAAALAGFTVRVVLASASDRFGVGPFIAGGAACYAASMATLAIARTPTEFLLAGVLEGLASGVLLPAIITLLAGRTVPAERGFVFGLALSGFDCGIAIAGPLMGQIATGIGLGNGFAVTTGLSLVALALFALAGNGSTKMSLCFAIGKTKDIYALAGAGGSKQAA